MTYHPIWNVPMETMPWDSVREIQEAKLKKQLAYVCGHSEFYRRKFREHGFEPGDFKTLDDLDRIPFTVKQELRDSQVEAPPLGTHTAADLEKVIRIHSTSGTTGRPTYIGLTKSDIQAWMEVHSRIYWCAGFRPADRVLFGYGLSMFVGGIPIIEALQNIGCTVIPIGPREGTDRFLSLSRDLGANALVGTPSFALYLIDRVQDSVHCAPKDLGWKKMAVGGEPGGSVPSIRHHLEEVYHTDVRDSGCGGAEMIAGMWADCEEKSGMHFVAQEYCLPELVDPDTLKPIPFRDGVEGELVYTALDRECLIVSGINVFPSAIKDVVTTHVPDVTGELRIVLTREPVGSAVNPPLTIEVEHGVNLGPEALRNLKSQLEREMRDKLLFKADIQLVAPGRLERSVHKSSYVRHAYRGE
ncbi:MAG: AMP-binding protein [Deltaproteobacteria bacterium]|nr:AMP-binding protein [Deltaproteobacteria bacterium]